MRKIFLKKWLIVPAAAILVFGLTQLAWRFPGATEMLYSRGIYPVFATIFSWASHIFPFSLDDIFYALLVISLFMLILLVAFRKIKLATAGKVLLNVAASVYILFYFLWGFNYFRSDIYNRLGLKHRKADTREFVAQLRKLVDNTNKTWCTFDNWEPEKADARIEASYKNLAPALGLKYPMGKRKAKPITVSGFFAQAGISGYYGPFFNEVHVNARILPIEYPFILAHEKAHQFGVTNEAEANFYAWLVCTKSKSKQLQYSANLHVLQYFLYQGYKLDEYDAIIARLDKRVKKDLQKIREHWMSMRNEKIDEAASKVNDFYLKTNKIKEGVKEYSGVVKFVMDYAYDNKFREKLE